MLGKWSGLACGLALTGVLAASAAAQEQAAESEWTRPDVAKAVWLDPVEEMELALSAAPITSHLERPYSYSATGVMRRHAGATMASLATSTGG